MSKKENRFYFEGVFYDSKEDFNKAVKQYANSEISPITAERILQDMSKNIVLNLFNGPHKDKILSNGDLKWIADEIMNEFTNRYRKKCDENEVIIKKNERTEN